MPVARSSFQRAHAPSCVRTTHASGRQPISTVLPPADNASVATTVVAPLVTSTRRITAVLSMTMTALPPLTRPKCEILSLAVPGTTLVVAPLAVIVPSTSPRGLMLSPGKRWPPTARKVVLPTQVTSDNQFTDAAGLDWSTPVRRGTASGVSVPGCERTGASKPELGVGTKRKGKSRRASHLRVQQLPSAVLCRAGKDVDRIGMERTSLAHVPVGAAAGWRQRGQDRLSKWSHASRGSRVTRWHCCASDSPAWVQASRREAGRESR